MIGPPAVTRGFVTAGFPAFLCLLIRGLEFPNPKVAVTHRYTNPGYVFWIPAVPRIKSCQFGVALLRRAGRD